MTPLPEPKVFFYSLFSAIFAFVALAIITNTYIDTKDPHSVLGEKEIAEHTIDVPTTKEFKLLGVFSVQAPITAVVSEDSGKVIRIEEPIGTQIIDLLSP